MFSNVLSVLLPLLYGAIHVFLIRKRRETDLWWSQITTLEKEISYRTEQGLYYSYYKVLVEERNFFEGLRSLFSENRTESPVVINIFKRMNIFPEIVLSVLYRLSRWMSPIDFYDFSTAVLQALTLIGVCFAIQDLQVQQLTSALLYAVLFISNQHEMSRVAFALPLRENFALPFWWLRLFFIIRVVSPRKRQLSLNSVHLVNVVLLITTTVAFCITWQFCQFVLLLEACIIAPLFHIGYLQDKQCLVLCTINVFGLISTSLVQAGSLFPFASPCFALLLTHILWIWFKFWLLSHSGVRNATSKCPPSTSARFRDFVLNQFISKSFYHPLPIFAKCFLFTALSCISKYTVPAEDATHILKFVLQKLNIWHQLDFHATLYLCSGAFQSMNIHSYLTDGLEWSKWVWPSYIFGMVWLSQIGHSRITRRLIKTIKKLRLKSSKNCKRSPTTKCEPGFEVYKIWHFAYNIIFGILAWSTVRMKYLWTPHLLLVSTCGLVLICEQTAAAVMPVLSRLILARQIWSQKQCNDSQKGRKPNKFSSTAYRKRLDLDPFQCIIWRWRLAYILALALTVYFLIHTSHQLTERFKDLGEFYDPDTVELMHWIRNNTEPAAIFTGSMQLMAGVKLCTGRPIANHPHYESAQLRERTRQLYQIYGKKPLLEVYNILLNHSISYVIIENSICFAESTGCAEKDVVDLDNKQWPDLWFTNVSIQSTGQLNAAYRLDEPTRQLLKKPGQNAKRFCADVIQLFDTTSHHYMGLQKRRTSRFFKLVFKNPTFYVFKLSP